jgi:hypothetical protein
LIRKKTLSDLSGGYTNLTVPVELPTTAPSGRQVGGAPWMWSDVMGGIVYQRDQSAEVYLLESADGWSTVTHTLLTTDENGADVTTAVTASAQNPPYQRFRTIEYGSTVLHVGVATVDKAVWAVRLA